MYRTRGETGATVRLINREDERRTVSATVDRDGAFTIRDVAPGNYDLAVDYPSTAYIRNVSLGGRDVQFGALRIDPGFAGRLEIQVSSSVGSVDGRAVAAGAAIPGTQIVLVPEERYRRRPERYLLGATDSMGEFRITNAPPGEYTAFAFEEIEPGAYYDAAFLRKFPDRGVRVRIDPNVRPMLELQVISAADAGVAR